MSSILPLSPLAVAVVPNADIDARWAAWVARGQAHDENVRRKVRLFAGALAVAAAVLYVVMG